MNIALEYDPHDVTAVFSADKRINEYLSAMIFFLWTTSFEALIL